MPVNVEETNHGITQCSRAEEKRIAVLGAKTSNLTTLIRRLRRSVFYPEDGSSRFFEALVFICHTMRTASMRNFYKI
jgi:hypothetical protein